MAVFNRVCCPDCKQASNIYSEKIKEFQCSKCSRLIRIPREGNFFIEYYVERRRRREKIGTSRTLAETVLAKRKVEVAEGRYLDKKKEFRVKFDDFCEEYLELHSKVNNRSWEKSDAVRIRSLKKFFSGKYLDEITPHLIEKFKAERRNTPKKNKMVVCLKNVSQSTINRELAVLKGIFSKAILWKRFNGRNPVKEIKLFQEKSERLRFLEREEIKSLLKECEEDLKPFVIFALNTGLRYSEQMSLKWRDLDFERGIIHLSESKNGEKAEIPLNSDVKNALIVVKKQADSPYIFCREDGTPFVHVRGALERALKKVGISNFHWHDIRHCYGSHLAMAGVDIYTIMKLMRHKSIKMTMRYAHLSPEHKKNAVELLNGLSGVGSVAKVADIDTIWTPMEVSERIAQDMNVANDSIAYR
jgi:integrase/ribosomal protein S27E